MNQRLLELREERGAIRARLAAQRETLAGYGKPIAQACAVADLTQKGVAWVKRHPALVGTALAVWVAKKPRRLLRWGGRLWWASKIWRAARRYMPQSVAQSVARWVAQ